METVVFEGNVQEVSSWITEHIGDHQTVPLQDHFNAEVWGVYKNGEENYRYYYQCLGHGRYSIFIIQ